MSKFYLGGGSSEAAEFSAKHAHVHLFWGDTVERIESNIYQIRKLASKYKREREIGFGMRLQIICRETEAEAWAVAEGLIKNVTDDQKNIIKNSSEYENYSKETNKKISDNMYQSYDYLLNEKYKVKINQKTLERVKNYYR